MSQLDVIDAKKALTARLVHWGVEAPATKAEGFIDDLVSRGWVMSPQRETRPAAPTREQACRDCGRWLHQCMCPEPVTRPVPPADPSTRAAAIAAARAALRQGQAPDETQEETP